MLLVSSSLARLTPAVADGGRGGSAGGIVGAVPTLDGLRCLGGGGFVFCGFVFGDLGVGGEVAEAMGELALGPGVDTVAAGGVGADMADALGLDWMAVLGFAGGGRVGPVGRFWGGFDTERRLDWG